MGRVPSSSYQVTSRQAVRRHLENRQLNAMTRGQSQQGSGSPSGSDTLTVQHCIRSGVRAEILNAFTDQTGWAEQFKVSHPLPIVYYDGAQKNFIVPQNSTLATLILKRISDTDKDGLLKIFIDLANALAPRVNPRTITLRTPEARLAGRLFDYDQVTESLLGGLSERFYAAVEPAWQWNSRYWGRNRSPSLG
jgi:hypothetical protein